MDASSTLSARTLDAQAAPRATDAPAGVVCQAMTLVVFSGEFDKWMAAFTLATSAAASGIEVRMYFTFWGVLGLRRRRRFSSKAALDRLLTAMLPAGLGTRTSQLNLLGLGAPFFRFVMRRKCVASLEELIELARSLGVQMTVCRMSMQVMGVESDELVEGLEFGGATTCVRDLQRGGSTLFI